GRDFHGTGWDDGARKCSNLCTAVRRTLCRSRDCGRDEAYADEYPALCPFQQQATEQECVRPRPEPRHMRSGHRRYRPHAHAPWLAVWLERSHAIFHPSFPQRHPASAASVEPPRPWRSEEQAAQRQLLRRACGWSLLACCRCHSNMGRRNSLTSMQRAQPRTLLPIAELSWLCLHKCEVYLVTLEYGLITYYVKRYGDRRFDLDQWTTARARR